MTLAAAKNSYNRLKYFSFISSEAERKDAISAHEICSNLKLNHKIFEIPEDQNDIDGYEIMSSIMQHNQAYIKSKHGSDVRKRIYLANNASIKVEIKSHASEVGRAFYYKKLGKNKFKYPLSSRNMSNLAKRNFFNRKILADMDKAFEKFIEISKFGDFPKGYDETDMFYWENRMPAWGSIAKQSFDISHETTIIYNNRKLLEQFLSFDFKDRLTDGIHHELIKEMNSEISEMGISNGNAMKNKRRILLERIFFEVNSLLP